VMLGYGILMTRLWLSSKFFLLVLYLNPQTAWPHRVDR